MHMSQGTGRGLVAEGLRSPQSPSGKLRQPDHLLARNPVTNLVILWTPLGTACRMSEQQRQLAMLWQHHVKAGR